jgi:hypothetical protein
MELDYRGDYTARSREYLECLPAVFSVNAVARMLSLFRTASLRPCTRRIRLWFLLQHLARVRARSCCDRHAAQHPGNFVDAFLTRKHSDAGACGVFSGEFAHL